MIVRALDANQDMQFGQSSANFLANSPAAVGQCVQTALRLNQGEWYLDQSAGVPWYTEVLGAHTNGTHDLAIRGAILAVPGVTEIVSFSSTVNPSTRRLTVSATLNTLYGETEFTQTV